MLMLCHSGRRESLCFCSRSKGPGFADARSCKTLLAASNLIRPEGRFVRAIETPAMNRLFFTILRRHVANALRALKRRQRATLDFQTLDDTAMLQMLIYNLIDVVFIRIGVPYSFRINRQHRPFPASIHTACVVDAAFSRPVHSPLCYLLLGIIP